MIGLAVLWLLNSFDISIERFWFQIWLEFNQRLSVYIDRVELLSPDSAPIIIDTGFTQSITYGPNLEDFAVYGIV